MPNLAIGDLTSLTAAQVSLANDLLVIVDASDQAQGTTKNITGGDFGISLGVVNVKNYGAVGDEVTDDTAAITAALAAHNRIYAPAGTYLYDSFTFPDDRVLYGDGQRATQLKKRSDGALITLGDRTCIYDVGINGDSKTGVCMTVPSGKTYQRLINVETRGCADNALTFAADGGAEFLALGCALATSLTPGSGAAVKISSGSDSSAIPRRFISCVAAGATLIDVAGMNNVHVAECRTEGILASSASGEVSIQGCRIGSNAGAITSITLNSISTGMISGNAFGCAVVLNNCSGVHFDNEVPSNNVTETGTKLNHIIIDRTLYTPVWTAASVNPSLGNGAISGIWSRQDRQIHVAVKVTMGSTTTFGTGAYSFSMPFSNASGEDYVGAVRALDSGTEFRIGTAIMGNAASTVQLYFDSTAGQASPTIPFTWASGDTIHLEIDFFIY